MCHITECGMQWISSVLAVYVVASVAEFPRELGPCFGHIHVPHALISSPPPPPPSPVQVTEWIHWLKSLIRCTQHCVHALVCNNNYIHSSDLFLFNIIQFSYELKVSLQYNFMIQINLCRHWMGCWFPLHDYNIHVACVSSPMSLCIICSS